jgi:hypothetical protein
MIIMRAYIRERTTTDYIGLMPSACASPPCCVNRVPTVVDLVDAKLNVHLIVMSVEWDKV